MANVGSLSHSQQEAFVLVVSDMHIGKKTPNYNIQKAQQIIEYIADRCRRFKWLLSPSYEFDEFVILSLGDMLDGSDIYPTQAHHQELTAVTAQAFAGAHILLPLINVGFEIAPKVRFVGVPGNHGRAGKNAHEAANWDLVLYQQLESIAKLTHRDKEKNLVFEYNMPLLLESDEGQLKVAMPEMTWMRLTQIKNHWFLLHHGHGNRSYAGGIPFYSLRAKANNWRSALDRYWRVWLLGHFHQFGWLEHNDIVILMNGTSVVDDVWSLETLGLRAINKFWVFGVSENFPITWQFVLNLTPEAHNLYLAEKNGGNGKTKQGGGKRK